MSATIYEVARKAGVSISTVSRVLNDSCPVHEDKRRRVEMAAESLSYTPNPAARSLLKRETGGLGVLLPFVGGEFFSELLNGIDRAAQEKGYFLLISTSHRDEREMRRAYRGMAKRVDGFLVMAPSLEAGELTRLLQVDSPVVFVNTRVEAKNKDVIQFENAMGSAMVTRHLLGYGHKRIAYIKGAKGAHDAQERLLGFRKATASARAECFEFDGDYSQESGYVATQTILAITPRPTAIIGANDSCATGILRALREAGLRVPEDVSVSGFDDVATAMYCAPPLTTVRIPVGDIGVRAINLLVERIQGANTEAPCREIFPVELVERESTGPVPRGW